MKSDKIETTDKDSEPKLKSLKTYRISEKDYARARRDRERLLEIKGFAAKIVKITSQVK